MEEHDLKLRQNLEFLSESLILRFFLEYLKLLKF